MGADRLPRLDVFDGAAGMAAAAAAALRSAVEQTLRDGRGRFTLALSGGSTPAVLYERLAREPFRGTLPWESLWILQGDERCVPPDHPLSNWRMARRTLLRHVGVSPEQVFRMRGEDPPEAAARAYEEVLEAVFEALPPAFDLVLLGLGEDGHTASLFPGSAALHERERCVLPVTAPGETARRITLTLPAINAARRVWFLVSGSRKRKALARCLGGPDPAFPASLVRPEAAELRFFADRDAAGGDEGRPRR